MTVVNRIVFAFVMLMGFCSVGALAEDRPKIRVGVLAIHFTDRIDKPGGVSRLDIVKHLPPTEFEIFPIVDEEVKDNDPAQEDMRSQLLPGNAIEISDLKTIKTLDVIIASREWQLTSAQVDVLHEAVSSGVGLLNQTSVALQRPGLGNPKVLDLHGMTEAEYFYVSSKQGEVPCVMLDKHELLEGIDEKHIRSRGLNGVIGILKEKGTPLIAAPNMKNQEYNWHSGDLSVLKRPTTAPAEPGKQPDAVFFLIYTSQLGKGRILACQWYIPNPPPMFDQLKDDAFYPRSVRWLAAGKK